LAILFLVAILLQYNTIQYIAQYIGGAIHLYQALAHNTIVVIPVEQYYCSWTTTTSYYCVSQKLL
jgi:hypothetical protein